MNIPSIVGRRGRVALLFAAGFVLVFLTCLSPIVPLGRHYHDFADKRALLAIPNCLNVLSNIPFIAVGAFGSLLLIGKSKRILVSDVERIPYVAFFLGVALTGIGSLYYHLSPNNSRLPWDLLPMSCSFAAMVVVFIMERISDRAGLQVFPLLVAAGVASIFYWWFTEGHHRGDTRFYLLIQFGPIAIVPLIVFLFPPKYTRTYDFFIAFVLFVIAKLFETFDWQTYSELGFISGHSLKHLLAGISCLWILRMLHLRKLMASDGGDVGPSYTMSIAETRELS